MAIAFTTITNSIAAIGIASVSDRGYVNVLDIDQIPDAVNARDCPILFPDPLGFISNFNPTRESQGAGSVAAWTITYNMNYMFLFAPSGTGRGLHDIYSDMLADVGTILDAIIENDTITGLVDLGPVDIGEFGSIIDPANVEFIGTNLVFQVTEFKN